MIDQNWSRWIFASMVKHFDSLKQDWPLHCEGHHLGDNDENAKHLEFRMDGPRYTQLSANEYRIKVEINILASAVMNDSDLYLLLEGLGIAAEAFHNAIPVYKYGDGLGDDGTLLGCMQLLTDTLGKQGVKTYNFGQIHQTQKIQQGTVEGHYVMFLKT
jgi:hypothetical protein